MDNKKEELGYEADLISLIDDDGVEYNFEVIDAIESDEGRYLAMLPLFDDPKKMLDDSGELVIVKVGEENGECDTSHKKDPSNWTEFGWNENAGSSVYLPASGSATWSFTIEPGERIAQMIVARHEQIEWEPVEELGSTERGAGGFGSTGK